MTSFSIRLRLIYFDVLLSFSQTLAAAFFLLAGYFFNTMEGGLAWNKKNSMANLNFHAVFMCSGLVVLQGEALLMFRLLRYEAKLLSKTLHVLFHATALSFAGFAIYSAVKDKNESGVAHFYSFHSWLGICVLTTYLTQFVFGLAAFSLGIVPAAARASFLPLHRAAGTVIFAASAAQCTLGAVTYSIYIESTPSFSCYSTLSCQSRLDLIFNFALCSLALYAISVVILVTPALWRRDKTPEEEE